MAPQWIPIACASNASITPFIAGCAAVSLCGATVLLGVVRNDHLAMEALNREWFPYPVNVMLHPVHDALAALAPTLILLNRGAHYAPDSNFSSGVLRALDFLAAAAPRAHVMLRDTPAGHPGCTEAAGILDAPPMYAANNTLWRAHHWADFHRQNELLHAIGAARGVVVVGFAHPTSMRPDGHASRNDCLHYKSDLPDGAMQTWVRLTAGAVSLMGANKSQWGR